MSAGVANFLFEAFNFLLLAALLGYVLWKPVRRALEAEQTRHNQELAQTEQARREADAALLAAKQARATAIQSTQEQRDKLLAAARNEAAQIVAQAQEQQADLQQAAEQQAAQAQASQLDALAESLAQLTAASVRSLLAQLDGPELDTALVRGACQQLRDLPQEARAGALVESAHALPDAARSLLEQALGGPLPPQHTRTLAELGAGVRVTTSQGQVDASALALARRAAQAVREAAQEQGHDHR